MNTYKILLIDDSQADIDYFELLLKKFKHINVDLTVCKRLDVDKHRPILNDAEVIYCDYNIQPEDGLNIAKKFRLYNKETPFVLLTGMGSEKIAVEAFELGVNGYLIKKDLNAQYLENNILLHIRTRDQEKFKKEAEQATQKALAMQKRINHHKSHFLSVVSHEIRTPLAIIREYNSLLYDEVLGKILPDQKNALEASIGSCDRLTHLIDDILDLEKIDSGRLTVNRKSVDLNIIIKNLYNDFILKHANILLDIDENLPLVVVDEKKLYQVLVNLLGNAIKFTPKDKKIHLLAKLNHKKIKISVNDEGVGIDKENHKKIFESFIQIDRGYKPGKQGTGLGLAIAKKLLDLNGSKLKLKSELNSGSQFYFDLPLYDQKFSKYYKAIDELRNKKLFQDSQKITIGTIVFESKEDFQKESKKIKTMFRKDEYVASLEQDKLLLFITDHKLAVQSICTRFENNMKNTVKNKVDFSSKIFDKKIFSEKQFIDYIQSH